MQEYTTPEYFQEDLFQHVGDRRRPPHKWLVLGPARSGSGLHVDPLATHAWNAVVHGHKRWALFPPGTPKEVRTLCRVVSGPEPGAQSGAEPGAEPGAEREPTWTPQCTGGRRCQRARHCVLAVLTPRQPSRAWECVRAVADTDGRQSYSTGRC